MLKRNDDQYDIEKIVNEYSGGGIASGANDSTYRCFWSLVEPLGSGNVYRCHDVGSLPATDRDKPIH